MSVIDYVFKERDHHQKEETRENKEGKTHHNSIHSKNIQIFIYFFFSLIYLSSLKKNTHVSTVWFFLEEINILSWYRVY